MRHLRSILILPGMGVIVIPALILLLTGSLNIGWSLPSPYNLLPILLGLILSALGLLLMIHTIRLFASIGKGTLAPWDPTRDLVLEGVYCYVRNPMISGVLCVQLGQAVLLGSFPLFLWFAFFLAANAIYIPLSEEPGLENRFGESYRTYKQNVPPWIPRRTPWESTTHQDMEHYD